MIRGIRHRGDVVYLKQSESPGTELYDVAVFYGLSHGNKQIMEKYLAEGRPTLYIDLGYWNRHKGGRLAGYHKIVLNGIHPGEKQLHGRFNDRRYKEYNKPIGPKSSGKAILVAGMQPKASAIWGLNGEQWERETIAKLKKITKKEIIYRPKPSWKEAKPIEGTTYSPGREDLDAVLQRCSVVVSHHSNVCIDAVYHQIPNISVIGAGALLGPNNLEDVDTVELPPIAECKQWLNALAFCQWSVEEIRLGNAWNFYKERYLL